MGAAWGPLGGALGPLGASLAPLGAILGALGAFLGPPWRISTKHGGGHQLALSLWSNKSRLLGLSQSAFGPLLGAPGAALGQSWASLRALLRAILEPSRGLGSPSEATGPEGQHHCFSSGVERIFGVLGASLGVFVRNWTHLRAIMGPLGGILGAIASQFGQYCAILEAV